MVITVSDAFLLGSAAIQSTECIVVLPHYTILLWQCGFGNATFDNTEDTVFLCNDEKNKLLLMRVTESSQLFLGETEEIDITHVFRSMLAIDQAGLEYLDTEVSDDPNELEHYKQKEP